MSDPQRALRPELQVLLCCARRNLESAQRQKLESLLRAGVNWDALLTLAADHGLLPLLHQHLRELPQGILPSPFREVLHERNKKNELRALFLTAELFRILNVLKGNRISAVAFKGPVLAARAYGSPFLRHFDDLDILVQQEDIPSVHQFMISLDYLPKSPPASLFARHPARSPGEYVFVHKVNRAMVEVHSEATLRHFPIPPDLGEMFRRTVPMLCDGHTAQALAPEDELLMLSVHGAKDFWARLIWVADLAAIVTQSPQLDWQAVFRDATRTRAERMVKLGLSLSQQILGAPLPPDVESWVADDRVVSQFSRAICMQLLEGSDAPESLLRRSRYRIHLVPGLANGLRYWLRLSTSPETADWSKWQLPDRFDWTYSLLRPLRLWRKYRASASRTA